MEPGRIATLSRNEILEKGDLHVANLVGVTNPVPNYVSEYIIEEKNVIAIKMNNEYYKIIYKLDGDSLTLTIPDKSGVSELKYTRKSD